MALFAEVDPIAFWTAIITVALTGIGGIVTSVVGMILAHKKLSQVGKDLKENTLHINSMKDQLVAAEKGLSRAEGKEEGVKIEQDRKDSRRSVEEQAVAIVLKDGEAGVEKGDKLVVEGAEKIAVVKAKEPK